MRSKCRLAVERSSAGLIAEPLLTRLWLKFPTTPLAFADIVQVAVRAADFVADNAVNHEQFARWATHGDYL